MKTLYLVRHAKSSKDDPSLPDRKRPLNDRGERDAPMMGERLASRQVEPDLIVSSPAVRALRTATIFAKKLGYKAKDIVEDERLYASTPGALLEVIRQLDDKHECVMLFGHNPELTSLAHRLSGTIADMPTCAVAELTFDATSWSAVGVEQPVSSALDRPKSS